MRRQLSDGILQAMTDPLTGLYNRRYALNRLSAIAEASVAGGKPFAVMVLDLDHFKRVNDAFGHAAGDAVLVEVAKRVAAGMRARDFVARLGGEEFIVVLPETSVEAARSTAERLRRVVEATEFVLPGADAPLSLTVSIGVALGGGSGRTSADALVGLADTALYSAKAEGRNKVTFGRTAA
jgi:two-component system cell cycle response regulator